MKYTDKSFSVSMGNISQERWDSIFGKKDAPEAPADAVAHPVSVPEPAREPEPAPDYSDLQCASCLERGQMMEAAPGLLQCGICLARFPLGLEQAQKFTGDRACINCGGTGRLRTTFTLFACGACGGTGSRQA